jgi:regulation of enolase protein 1 (concanavalin A-like superfamily)
MQRVRYAYENVPDHIRAGATNYNKGSIEFDNGSRIVSATTTENTGRGMSISLLYCLDGETTTVNIRNKHTLVEEEITLKDLYIRLYNPFGVID